MITNQLKLWRIDMDENVLSTKQFGGNTQATANKEKKLSVKSVLKLCSIVLYRFTQSFFSMFMWMGC